MLIAYLLSLGHLSETNTGCRRGPIPEVLTLTQLDGTPGNHWLDPRPEISGARNRFPGASRLPVRNPIGYVSLTSVLIGLMAWTLIWGNKEFRRCEF